MDLDDRTAQEKSSVQKIVEPGIHLDGVETVPGYRCWAELSVMHWDSCAEDLDDCGWRK